MGIICMFRINVWNVRTRHYDKKKQRKIVEHKQIKVCIITYCNRIEFDIFKSRIFPYPFRDPYRSKKKKITLITICEMSKFTQKTREKSGFRCEWWVESALKIRIEWLYSMCCRKNSEISINEDFVRSLRVLTTVRHGSHCCFRVLC